MNKKVVFTIVGAIFLAGCASGVTRTPSITVDRAALSPNNQVASVSVSLTDEAKKKETENLKFNPEELLSHVKRAIEAQSLLNGSGDKPRPNLEIQIKDMRIRSNFSAVMWGFMAGADSVTGDIVLKDPGGKEIDRYEVSVSYAMGGIGGGQDSARMGWLYEKFAEETVKELTRQ